MFNKEDFIRVNIDNNGSTFICYLTKIICIIPGMNIYYISPNYWGKIKSIFPSNTEDILYPNTINDAIALAARGNLLQLELIVSLSGKNTSYVLEGNDDPNLLH